MRALSEALFRALDATAQQLRHPQPARLVSARLNEPLLSVDFSGGSLLRALNAVVRAKTNAEWRVAYGKTDAVVMVGRLSTLDTTESVLVKSITWTPNTASRR